MNPFQAFSFLREQNGYFTYHLMQNDLVSAKKVVRTVMRKHPKSAELASLRGRLLRTLGRIEEGDALIQQAVDQRAAEIAQWHPTESLLIRMQLFSTVVFLGGQPNVFETVGQNQFQTLVKYGLQPHHKVLDVGCGCLRAGHLLIPYLNPGNYCGIEPYKLRVQFGLDHVLTEESRARNPQIAFHTDFSFSVFNRQFDFVLARSVWTHTSRQQIITMLDEFLTNTGPDAQFLTSYVPAPDEASAYLDDEWLGRSDVSEQGGYARHSLSWIQEQAASRGLTAVELDDERYQGQVWLRIARV